MNKSEYLLTCLSEECAEVSKACSKAQRFGLQDKPYGKPIANVEKIMKECLEVNAVVRMLQAEGVLPEWPHEECLRISTDKMVRVKDFMEYSKQQGTLRD